MTMISGFGSGQSGSELKDDPREASRARNSSERSALSKVGMGTELGLRASPILENNRGVEGTGRLSLDWIRGVGLNGFGARIGGWRRVRDRGEQRNLRNIEVGKKGALDGEAEHGIRTFEVSLCGRPGKNANFGWLIESWFGFSL